MWCKSGLRRKDVNECKSVIRVGREPRGVRVPYRKGMSKHYIFFNFGSTQKKYSGILQASSSLV